jgi:LDH2 family malate/lactate/ureidoglycolate dehydrogenase
LKLNADWVQSHGVMLVELYVDRLRHGSVATNGGATIVSDRGVAIVMDAGHESGYLSAARVMGLAVERAQYDCRHTLALRASCMRRAECYDP